MKIEIHIFAEGQTERKVIDKLRTLLPNYSLNVVECGGKTNINRQLQQKLRFSLNLQPVRALILRDLDDGETYERIVQSVRDGMIQVFRKSNINEVPQFAPLPLYKNIYAWKSASLNFHIAVHIADYDYRWDTSFTKSTIDDLVLRLAFDPNVATILAQRQNVNVNGQVIIQKVTQEIPALLQQNGFPLWSEAKDYVRLYAAVIRMHTSPPVFAANVLAGAKDHLVQQNFASIIAAIEALQ